MNNITLETSYQIIDYFQTEDAYQEIFESNPSDALVDTIKRVIMLDDTLSVDEIISCFKENIGKANKDVNIIRSLRNKWKSKYI